MNDNMLEEYKAVSVLIAYITLLLGANAEIHYEQKNNIFSDALLNDLLMRMDNDMQAGYYDADNEGEMAAAPPKDNVDLVSRSEYGRLCDGDADCLLQSSRNPSLRDHEFMQHSSLWGHQYVSGGMGEMPNGYNIVKTDASLPAYCNPPNPCPAGYDMEQQAGNCIADFDNTAIYSREFQAAQDCTCDSEHMFDCADQENAGPDGESAEIRDIQKFLMDQFGKGNGVDRANAVAKKAARDAGQLNVDVLPNPFLQVGPGDRLPIAAKKGNMLFH
ncbi:7B2 [Drosophila busckii]|uniref:Neuroendocrine protein 7B2 n=1 Tax=Drosophila busckii TaxID=30019 RepID=A0A0M3QXJ0_DROBS|nr:neuroendocrine protein 7B2 [Drosophila busckii]ALC45949.1 7B2 [Drosophila busckii]